VVAARRLVAVAGAAFALALLGSSPSLAATRTTQPGKTIQVYFIFTDQKLLYGLYREGPGGPNDLYVGTFVARGDYAHFFVINRGKKTHSFVFMKRTFTVKPGGRAKFTRFLLTRGRFPYSSPSNPGKAFTGLFRVY